MKINLDKDLRKYIELDVEIDDKNETIKYYEKNTKQTEEIFELAKSEKGNYEFYEVNKKHFLENLSGDKKVISSLVKHLETQGNIYAFIEECNKELGKLKESE